ncbi:MAG: hypothetical protein ACJ8H8_18520, partial [Geminicoccaceae bacterium]
IANDRHLRSFALDVDPAREPGSMLVELWGLPDLAPKKRGPRAGQASGRQGPEEERGAADSSRHAPWIAL